ECVLPQGCVSARHSTRVRGHGRAEASLRRYRHPRLRATRHVGVVLSVVRAVVPVVRGDVGIRRVIRNRIRNDWPEPERAMILEIVSVEVVSFEVVSFEMVSLEAMMGDGSTVVAAPRTASYCR